MTHSEELTSLELEKLELMLAKLEHHPKCPVKKEHYICECGLSSGRHRLYNYIESMRNALEQNAKSN